MCLLFTADGVLIIFFIINPTNIIINNIISVVMLNWKLLPPKPPPLAPKTPLAPPLAPLLAPLLALASSYEYTISINSANDINNKILPAANTVIGKFAPYVRNIRDRINIELPAEIRTTNDAKTHLDAVDTEIKYADMAKNHAITATLHANIDTAFNSIVAPVTQALKDAADAQINIIKGDLI